MQRTPGMTTDQDPVAVAQSGRITREYHDRRQAERAVERLRAAGFSDDVVTMQTHGGHTRDDGVFLPGAIEVVVLAGERASDAEALLAGD